MTRLPLLKKLLLGTAKNAEWLIRLNLIAIVVLTWMPFNFAVPLDFSWSFVVEQFRETPYTSNATDITVNVLFFIPFGIGWGAWFYRRRPKTHPIAILVGVLLISFGLSLTVEIGQLFLVSREPGMMDLATNSLGGFLGASLFLLVTRFQQLIMGFLGIFAILKRPQILLRVLTIFWLAYLGLMAGLLINVADRNQFSNWQNDFPLLVGNENTGDRPWLGAISYFCLSDTAMEATNWGQAIADNPCPRLQQATEFSAYYSFAPGAKIYSDLANNSPALQSLRTPVSDRDRGITLGKYNMLTSMTPPELLNQRIKDSSQFTLIANIATDNPDQEGPARIISLSRDHHHRNLTVAQSRQDLSFRLTMPFTGINGKKPEIRLNNFFIDLDFHPLGIIYDGSELTFISDRFKQTLYLGSESALFWSIFGIIGEKMFLIVNVDWFNKILYYSFIFAPLGLSFGWIYRLLQTTKVGSIILLACGFVIPPLLVEGIIVATSRRDFIWQYPLLGCAILILGFLLTRFTAPVTHNN